VPPPISKRQRGEDGKSISAIKDEPLAIDVSFDDDSTRVALADAQGVILLLEWFPRLRDAAGEERSRSRLVGGGIGTHGESVVGQLIRRTG
jgi:hypothetical protein